MAYNASYLYLHIFKAEKEQQVRSTDFGHDLSSVQLLLNKQDAFDSGLNAFEHDGIQRITELKDQLIRAQHEQSADIEKRHSSVMSRWQQLLGNSLIRRQKLMDAKEYFKKVFTFNYMFASYLIPIDFIYDVFVNGGSSLSELLMCCE